MKNHKVGCELCEAPANMYCESDRASLCWRCDNKVHGANFLVAKHSRCVLCHHCQAVTPWTASGPKLPPSMSLCLSCATTTPNHDHNHDHNNTINRIAQVSLQSRVNDDQEEEEDVQSSLYVDDDEEECSTDEEDEEDEDEEDNENQVVPLTFDIGCGRGSATPASVEISGCSSDETEEEDDNSHMLALLPPSSLKRKRDVFVSN